MFHLGKVISPTRKTFNQILINEEDSGPMDVMDIQYYNPTFSFFFDKPLEECIELNHKYHIFDGNHVMEKNKKVKTDIFIKYSPLLDPVHFLIGKYDKEREKIRLPKTNNINECLEKLFSPNNASYVDNFFNYLSGQLLNHHGVLNGIDYYGSNLAIQKKFRYNVFDDIEYLEESSHFLKNNGNTYVMERLQDNPHSPSKNTQSNRPKIFIKDEVSIEDDFIEIIDTDETNIECNTQTKELITSEILRDNNLEEEVVLEMQHDSGSDSDDSEISISSTEDNNSIEEDSEEDEDGDEDDSEDNSEMDEDESEELYAFLFNFPVQMIALEKCDGTVDSLLEQNKINEDEFASIMMQVIFTLLIYQKTFAFTHNDLHTNNIVFKQTNKKYISYCWENVHYKVPTYGRLIKIIDFGRSIYRFQDKIMCSDSFAPGGDANGQYNCEPYFNESKPRLEPNFGFDLCRLGCSMYDFVFDIGDEIKLKEETMSSIQKTIFRWCKDDSGRNILYKRNGEERYPNFKLYKMISRTSHAHTPENQLQYPMFSKFKTNAKKPNYCINIDKLPKYWNCSN